MFSDTWTALVVRRDVAGNFGQRAKEPEQQHGAPPHPGQSLFESRDGNFRRGR